MTLNGRTNKDILVFGIDIFRDAMRDFLVMHLDGVQGLDVEGAVRNAFQYSSNDRTIRDLQDHIDTKKPIEDFIDVLHFRQLLTAYWRGTFDLIFKEKDILDDCWNIVTIRNKTHHPRKTFSISSSATKLYLHHIDRALGLINRPEEQARVRQLLNEFVPTEAEELESEVGQLSLTVERQTADVDEKIESIVHELDRVNKDIGERDEIIEAYHDALDALSSDVLSLRNQQLLHETEIGMLRTVINVMNGDSAILDHSTLQASVKSAWAEQEDVEEERTEQRVGEQTNGEEKGDDEEVEALAQIDYALDHEWLVDGEDYILIGDKEILVDLLVNNADDRYTESHPPMSELGEYERMVVKGSMRRLLNTMPTARFYCTKDRCVFSDGNRRSWYNENKAVEHQLMNGHKVRDLDE